MDNNNNYKKKGERTKTTKEKIIRTKPCFLSVTLSSVSDVKEKEEKKTIFTRVENKKEILLFNQLQ